MALHTGLPVYKSTYDFLLAVFIFSKNFTREYKYTLGQEIKSETMKLLLCIYRANSSVSHRKNLLQDAREVLEVIRLLIRITKDLKQINLEDFVDLNEQIEEISKQLVGWERYTNQKIGS